MISINNNILNTSFIFLSVLIIITFYRKYLTYRGIQFLLIMLNIFFVSHCFFSWDLYLVNNLTEHFSLRLNNNTWNNVPFTICLNISSLNFLFILLVSAIGLSTNIYILDYFKQEERPEDFILLINWFTLSMIFLVISENMFTLIIGWEMIGLTSFFLINFWKNKSTTFSCSFKAYAFNKVSDLFLMLGCALLWNKYDIHNITTLLNYISMCNSNNYIIICACVCFLISACVKSAQLLGHLWLPDSMEAPVPASSLIHSATLVSAGIYLILKLQTLFIFANLLNLIFFIGAITGAYGAIVASCQTDIKKLLAYSTISHCGFIMCSISFNQIIITITYLYLHGLFKALSFFCAGSIIKNNNIQDMRLMGLVCDKYTVTCLIFAVMNLGGLPFTIGYLYKDLFINQLTISNYSYTSLGFCFIGLLSSVVYVYKLIYYSSFDFRKGFINYGKLFIQNNNFMRYGMITNFTYSRFLSSLTLYIFSCFLFFTLKHFFLENYTYFQYIPDVIPSEYKFFQNYYLLKTSLISIYYTLFLFTTIVLTLNSYRSNYFYHSKLAILINTWGLLNYLFILNYTMGVLFSYVV